MRVTKDRLAVAEAVIQWLAGCGELPIDEREKAKLRAVIEALPEPEPDVQAQDDEHDCHWRRLDDARRENKVVQNSDVQAQDYRLPRTMSVIRNALNGPSPAEAVADLLAIARESGRMEKQAQIDAAVNAYRKDMHECEQIAGRALGYPRYCDDQQNFPEATDADGVCVGAHVAPTIVAELAEKYRAAMSELVRWRNTAANQMIDAAVAREREEIKEIVAAQQRAFSNDEYTFTGEVLLAQFNVILHNIEIRARSAKGV